MPELQERISSRVRRTVRVADVDARNMSAVANGIEDMYDDELDVVVVRNALDGAMLARVGDRLDSGALDVAWARPNEKMPVEDLQLFGTDTPATPTFQAPRGASLDDYLSSAVGHALRTASVFADGFDATREITDLLARFAGGRPVELPHATDGRTYAPFTIRRLVDGKQIGVHHDYHYRLDLYRELSPQVDTRTLVSYVATLQAPQTGGELVVYGAASDDPELPKLPNGFSYDVIAIEERYEQARVVTGAGDLFLLASGRCLHRVNRIAGPRARVTMGGFLALDNVRERVLFWS